MPLVDITDQDEAVLKQLFDLATVAAPAGSRLQVAGAGLMILQKIESAKKIDAMRSAAPFKKEKVE
jgi:hypothetical protein